MLREVDCLSHFNNTINHFRLNHTSRLRDLVSTADIYGPDQVDNHLIAAQKKIFIPITEIQTDVLFDCVNQFSYAATNSSLIKFYYIARITKCL
jgi:hypothetical protein